MKREERLEKELQFHLDRRIADLIAGGYSPEEARRLARIELGGPEQVKEACRDVRPTRRIEDLFQDVRYALRSMRRRPGFTIIALLTLALGVGATTVIFTVLDGVLLKPLPYADPGRLVKVEEQTDFSTALGNRWSFSYPNFLDCARASHFLDMAALRYIGGTISGPGPAEHATAAEISPNLFHILGVNPIKGRVFGAEEDRPGAPPAAIITYELWQQRFAGRDAALGSSVVFNGDTYMVIGVAPPRFNPGYMEANLFTLAGQDGSPHWKNRGVHPNLLVWARLRPGATLAQANAELGVIARQLEAQYPLSNKGRTFVAEPIHPEVGDARQTLWLLLGAVSLLLLIGCANVAGLLLARAVSRERELAMRLALGAGRGRLARQSLTESAVLGLAGGAAGVALAIGGLHPFIKFWPGDLPRAEEVQLDWRVLLFALAISLASGLLFGIAPALRAASRDLERRIRGARAVPGGSRRVHNAFVISQIALAMVLLVSAGMLARTMLRLSALDPGLNIHNVLTARAALSPATLADPARTRAAWREILDRARRIPGVRSIAMIDTVPMRQGTNQIGYRTSAAEEPPDRQALTLSASVTPEYLDVMGIPLRRGRFFTDQDRAGRESVVVIDEVMARQAFPGQDPIGKQLWFGIIPDPATVVGVVGHVRQWGLAGDDGARVRAQLYYPWAQVHDVLVRRWSELMSIAVRTDVDPLTIVEPLRRQVRGVTNDQVLYEVRTMEQLASASLARQRFLLLLFGVFAGLALLLASIGIYGVLAYLTGLRVPEIGVRMALGAASGQVMWMVMRQSLAMVACGVIIGASGAVASARVLVRFVIGMQPAGPWTFAATIGVLVLAALAASFVPARRASRIDPVSALRSE